MRSVSCYLLCSALSAAVLLTPASLAAQQQAARVLIDTVDMREVRDTQPVIGQLVATRRAGVATRIAGIIETVSFNIGDRVAKDQVLVTLDKSRTVIEHRAAEASVGVAEAGIQVADAKLKLAEQAFERQESLRRSTAFSRSRYDDLKQAAVQSRSERAQAEAQLLAAKSNLARTEYELTHAVIKAPFDGIIIARQAQPGQYVSPGAAVATLLDITNLEVEADVPANIANGLTAGIRVEAVFDGGQHKQVTVRTTIPVENVSTRTRPVRFSAKLGDLKAAQVAIGSTVTLQIPVSAPRKVVAVPKDALLQGRRGGWMVFVAANNKAQPRPVELGQAVGNRIEIRSGLEAGELVVVRGNERLRPGQTIEPHPVKAGSSGKAKTEG